MLTHGGTCTEDYGQLCDFIIQIDGLCGIGLTPAVAINDLISQARDVVMGLRCLDQQV